MDCCCCVQGVDWLLSVALAFLKNARKDLLAMSFEEILQYFRVTLPRAYHSDAIGAQLVSTAIRMKVTSKKMKKFEEEYYLERAAEAKAQDPLQVGGFYFFYVVIVAAGCGVTQYIQP